MTDVIDRAQQFDAMNLARALRAQAEIAAKTPRPKAAGYCLNEDCGEPFDHDSPRLFCGPACAQRYEMILNVSHQGA